MVDKELERLINEGLEALTKSRERLKADRDKPPNWKEITPEPLKDAVRHIRKEFETATWQLGEQIECACYISLHLELATLPRYKGRINLIRSDFRDTWHLQFEGLNEAERFAHWVEQYSDILTKHITVPFKRFLKIGLANQNSLKIGSVEWAKNLTRGLLYSLRWTIPHLIKRMCDEQDEKLKLNSDNFDAWCSWVYWRAPYFVHMQPSGNLPYAASAAWQRHEDANISENILRGLTGKMLDPAWFELDRLAGQAHVTLASQPSLDFWTLSSGETEQMAVIHEGLDGPTKASTTASDDVGSGQHETSERCQSGPANPIVIALQAEIDRARERMRHFEAEIAAVETKITAFQQSLVQIIVHGVSSFKPNEVDKAIRKLHADKKDLEFRRDDWQLNLSTAERRLQIAKNDGAEALSTSTTHPANGAAKHGASPAGPNENVQRDTIRSGQATPSQREQNLNYRSPVKRGIAWIITTNQKASYLAICRQFDQAGDVELPDYWKTGTNRSFECAYKDPKYRHKIEKLISRVRSDMRKKRLLE
jgi:hypothetical protein